MEEPTLIGRSVIEYNRRDCYILLDALTRLLRLQQWSLTRMDENVISHSQKLIHCKNPCKPRTFKYYLENMLVFLIVFESSCGPIARNIENEKSMYK